ncbi:Delta-like protein [Caenorhabditis elegans]|uniref:Delta-like protein n=1 Tax=Caenorhabditis elegans TaxID=6239 RepID=Q7YXD2_CAEEL|nr:Delta-like protein [Caenorhabditis elegans]CAD91627.1 Delta-like protein [Caenorhabditis elegans]|eukprot:NP_001023803.1 Delta-like protein [Caenorhabditis elegans]
MLTLWSLLLYTFIPLIQCTGYLELRLTSPYVRVLNVSVELAIGSEKSFYKVPLSPYYELAITNVPIEFDQPASIIIRSGPVKEIGLTDFVVSPKIFSTRKMSIVPPKAGLPFSGFRIDIKCDTNYFGAHCEHFCDEEQARSMGRRCNILGNIGCPIGVRGSKCDIELPIDSGICKCMNGGKCVNSFDSKLTADFPICECLNGFEGAACEKQMKIFEPKISTRLFESTARFHDLANVSVKNQLYDDKMDIYSKHVAPSFHVLQQGALNGKALRAPKKQKNTIIFDPVTLSFHPTKPISTPYFPKGRPVRLNSQS